MKEYTVKKLRKLSNAVKGKTTIQDDYDELLNINYVELYPSSNSTTTYHFKMKNICPIDGKKQKIDTEMYFKYNTGCKNILENDSFLRTIKDINFNLSLEELAEQLPLFFAIIFHCDEVNISLKIKEGIMINNYAQSCVF